MIFPKSFPRRLPEEKLAKVYSSLEEAFALNDHVYVIRYGQDNPELRGCSLLFLGNRVGGEKVLGSIKTGRACLYRALAAWLDGETEEACNWVIEGLAAGSATSQLKRFLELIDRKSFKVVIYNEACNQQFSTHLQNLPGLEVIPATYATNPKEVDQQVDLVLADFYGYPGYLVNQSTVNISDWKAPVVFCPADIEWRYDQYEKIMSKVDLLCCGTTSEMTEVGRVFNKNGMTCCGFPSKEGFEMKGLAQKFTRKKELDFLFTGGLTHDFYRDKYMRILPLAYGLDEKFKVKIHEGQFPAREYKRLLESAKFTTISTRYSNYWSGRNVEALATGVVTLISQESCMPYAFSEKFACFQVFDNEDVCGSIEKHLDNYDNIIKDLLPQLPQLEAEACSLFPDKKTLWSRYLKRLIFVTHMNGVTFKDVKPQEPENFLRDTLIASTTTSAPRIALLYHIDKGLVKSPESISLHYAKALLLRSEGRNEEAEKIFLEVAVGSYELKATDIFPYPWDSFFGPFWIIDARIRERSRYLDTLVPERKIWMSFAQTHRADIAFKAGGLPLAKSLAWRALQLFPYNDAAKRLYLRISYSLGHERDFIKGFYAAIAIDGRVLNDFAPMVIDILTRLNLLVEIDVLNHKLELFLKRVKIDKAEFQLYPEVLPLLQKYNLLHASYC